MTDAATMTAPTDAPAPDDAFPANPVVWTEIPVSDLEAAKTFYAALTGRPLIMNEDGPQPIAIFGYKGDPGISGHLYEGKPAADGSGPTVHFGCEGGVEAAAERCRAAGGEVISPIITIPAGRFQYAKDPDGNSIGLFEWAM